MEKVETFNQQPPPPQQQQLTMPLVANCVTAPNKLIKQNGEKSINEKTELKWPVKRKINKEERRKRVNARMRRLLFPKSPLVVFSELFYDVPIHLQEHRLNNGMSYTAIVEIDGQMYYGNHTSKTQAKQKACENFLRIMLAKKLSERSEKKESPMDVEMEIGESGSISKPEGPPQEDFPWPEFASLAMHNLINQWELQPVVLRANNYVKDEPTVIKLQPKVNHLFTNCYKLIDFEVVGYYGYLLLNELCSIFYLI